MEFADIILSDYPDLPHQLAFLIILTITLALTFFMINKSRKQTKLEFNDSLWKNENCQFYKNLIVDIEQADAPDSFQEWYED